MSIPVFSPRLWWSSLRRRWDLKHLQAPEFSYLFDPPPDDEWVCIDCETTGLNVASDAIVSVAAVLVRGQRICTSQRLELVVQASRNVPGKASASTSCARPTLQRACRWNRPCALF